MQPATIKLFLVNGSPTGLRTAEISNWSGKAIASPRSQLDELLKRPELQSPGVYMLSGMDAESGEPMIYIGEAEIVANRLRQHARNDEKDYWTHTYVFVSKDENLTKSHIRYIEGKMIQKAHSSKRVTVMNNAASGSSLPEADRADMDVFMDRMIQLLPVLGILHFSAPGAVAVKSCLSATSEKEASPVPVFRYSARGVTATGAPSEEGFVIFKGSRAVRGLTNSCPPAVQRNREKMLEKGVLVLDGESYHFVEDYELSSPSAAGCVISGRSTNGMTAWKADDNRTLREVISG
ncbi:GIY-YIG nuclease family protein [Sansalvadorimonas verongulae]|uniref:GIY-YIG nuclease family protein n=1 Tax=Sansalvadorimonas verongulae TaxID=2172824 RepID=UPI0012BB77AE|nr:GIY-YIG nuclease family protein [Sansalvadorimonas verongulae]MTI12112.1 GIY-YIG nuclease family protein [Sansalvadorimonas verongulae]